jgi:hypothetical protein
MIAVAKKVGAAEGLNDGPGSHHNKDNKDAQFGFK